MLQRNPESPNELPPTAEVLQQREVLAQEATEQRFQKYLTRRRRTIALGKFAVTTGLLINATVVSPYLADVRANMYESADAQPTIQIMADALSPENSNKATVFIHGFNTYGAKDLVRTIGPGYQEAFDSQLWSLQYNNAPLDGHKISNALKEEFEEEKIERADFVFYSEGGVEGTEDMLEIIKDTDIQVENVTYNQTPPTFDTLTDKTKQEIGSAKDLAWIPWIEYSTLFRLGLEGYFYRNEMQTNFANASNGIMTRYSNGDMTNNLFLGSQINKMVEANVPDEILKSKDLFDEKFRPNFNFIASENDIVVKNDDAIEAICEPVEEIGSECTVLSVEARHGEYFLPKSIEEYNAVYQQLAEIVAPYTTKEAARHALNLYGIYEEGSIIFRKK